MLPFLRDLPKAELHLHLETSLRLRRLMAEAPSASGSDVDPHLIADPAAFTGYDRLRRLRYASRAARVPDAMYTRDNVTRITVDLLREAAAENIRYVEIRVGGRRGFSLLGVRGILEAMARAAEEAGERWGIRSGILVTLVRERGPEEARELVAEALRCRDCGVVGFDLAGDEENFPPAIFAAALEPARDAGLGLTVHAGEFSGPASIWTALYQLGARRLGHGIRAAEDPELLAYLREHRITLELCPTSNIRLGLVHSLAEHPLPRFLGAGVAVTINCDDPLLLGTDLTGELGAVQQAFALPDEVIKQFMVTAAHAAFAPASEEPALSNVLVQSLGSG